MPEPPRAVLYCRVSTSGQQDNTSTAAQAVACARKAAELGAIVISVVEEVESGGLYLARPGIQSALADIEAGKANMLIVAKLDRTGRDVDDLRDIRRRLRAVGGQLVFADGLQFDSTPVGNLMFTQLAGFAEFEKETIRERTVKGLRNRAADNIQPARANAPYGYRIPKHSDRIKGTATAEEVGRYFIVEPQAQTVRDIFRLMVEGYSTRRIALQLHARAIPTPRGGKQWHASTMRAIIRNPAYKGQPAYSRTRRTVDESRRTRGLGISTHPARPQADWITLTGPAIVTPEQWQQANDLMDSRRAEQSGRRDRKYMLSGLLHCPVCDRRMYSRCGRAKPPKGYSYVCAGAVGRGTALPAKVCHSGHYSGPALDSLVIAAVLEMLDNPALIADANKRYQIRQKAAQVEQGTKATATRLKTQIQAALKRERALAESYIEARLKNSDGSAFETLRTETEAKRRDMESRLSELEAVTVQTPAPVIPDDVAEPIRAVLLSDRPSVEKGQLLTRICERIYPVPLQSLPPEVRYRGTQRNVGGVRIILRLPHPPFYWLSRVVVERKRVTKNYQETRVTTYKTTLTATLER